MRLTKDWLASKRKSIEALKDRYPTGIPADWQQTENLLDTIDGLESEHRAETAAMLEKAADNCRVRAISENVMRDMARKRGEESLANAHGDRACVLQEQEAALRALIPTDYAAALAERERKARLDQSEEIWRIWSAKDQVAFTQWLDSEILQLRAAPAGDRLAGKSDE